MQCGVENVDPMRALGVPVEGRENLSLNSLVPHNDWSAFRINPFSNPNMGRTMNNYGSQFLPQMEIGCPCMPSSEQRMMQQQPWMPSLDRRMVSQQPWMPSLDQRMMQQPWMPPNQHHFWDAYWKNYWQKYYREADEFRPSLQPRHRPDVEPYYEQTEEHEESEEHPELEKPKPKSKPRPEPNGRPEERPQRPEEDRPGNRGGRIVSAARESVGQQLFKFIPGTPGNLGCAASVSAALNKAGFNYARHAGVYGLSQQLEKNGWSKHEGIQDAKPGDVVVIVRRSGWQNGGGGSHIGIVGENGKVYHNSSGRQQWIEDSLQRVFGGGMQRFILRPQRA